MKITVNDKARSQITIRRLPTISKELVLPKLPVAVYSS